MEKIIDVKSSDQFKTDYTRYGVYVMYARVEADYRDGLKPVHRRILYSLWKDSHAVTSTVKSATVVGNIIGLWHPHGDCLSGDTLLYTLDNRYITIEDLYKLGIESVDILSVDTNTGKIVPAKARAFRIGQYTDKEYIIKLSNGAEVKCTSNHPFLMANLKYVCAKDLNTNMRLFRDRILTTNQMYNPRPAIQNTPLHELVHDYYYGKPPIGYERHHKDENVWNNKPDNLQTLTKLDHFQMHHNQDDSLMLLEMGRKQMFEDGGAYREKTIAKNSFLMKEYNKDIAIRRFQMVIRKMMESNIEVTENNYETFRLQFGKNTPIARNIIAKHPEYGCNSFEDLINYKIPTLGELFEKNKNSIYNKAPEHDYSCPIDFYLHGSRSAVYSVFDRILDCGYPLTIENYYAFRNYNQTKSDIQPEKIAALIDCYRVEMPYIVDIKVHNVNHKPMYDFTVDGTENMMIPVRSAYNNIFDNHIGYHVPMICVHNSAVYGAMQPLVNWFESKIPLMEGQGFFGNFQGNKASAYRYTECKISKFAYDYVIGDLRESPECVDWTPNFDNTDVEPQYLPAAVPLLLINGIFGIGVGKKPEIPTHNVNEVIDATIALIQNPNADIVLVPDHCMNCEIVDTDFAAISRLGFGFYTVRGVIDIENYTRNHLKNRTALVIKSVPNLTFLDSITDKIDDMIKSKKIVQIERMFDESTEYNMRYVIILKPGSDPEYVRRMIYQNTLMEQNCRVNFEALDGLNPKRFSYKSYLLSFIDQRKLTKFRVFSNKLQKVQIAIQEKEAYVKCLESGLIDTIIAKIKSRKTVADDQSLVDYLVKNVKITPIQAQYIINLPLKRLAVANLKKAREDLKALMQKHEEYMSYILDENKLLQLIVNELLEVKAKYGKPRTCRIVQDEVNSVPKGAMTVILTEKNFIKKVPFGSPIGNPRNDSIRFIINVDNSENILIFDNIGKAFKLPVNKIAFADKNAGGVDIRFLIKNLTANIASIIPEGICFSENTKGKPKNYIVTLSKAGHIKKMNLEDFAVVPSSGLIYAKIDQGDFIQSVGIAVDGMNVLVFSERKAMIVPINMVPLMKRNARGNKTFRASLVDGMTMIYPRGSMSYQGVSLMVITEKGRFNKIPIEALAELDVPKKAFNVIKINKSDRIIDIHVVNESSKIAVKTLTNLYSIPVNSIESSSTISAGVRVLNTSKDKIIRTYIEL